MKNSSESLEKASQYYQSGVAFQQQGSFDEAEKQFRKAIQYYPENPVYYAHLAAVFKAQNRFGEAAGCYAKLLVLKPDDIEIYNEMAIALQYQGRYKEAVSCFQKAIQIKPDSVELYHNLGSTFQHYGKFDEAISCYRKVAELNPNNAEAYAQLVPLLKQICAWKEIQKPLNILDDLTKKAIIGETKIAETPFGNIMRSDELSVNFAVAKSWAQDIANSVSGIKVHFSFDDRKVSQKKITVCYLSGDFRDHPVAHDILPLFNLHHRDEFEIFCYSYGPDDKSFYRKQVEQNCDKFTDLSRMSDIEAAQRIYTDRTDILVDLTGYTANNRLGICALRPAPVQATYLGFPATTGAEFFDYILTDAIVTPADHAPFYSEKFVYLPDTYHITNNMQAISDEAWSRKDLGLPENSFVFSSFNQTYKFDPVFFDIWMRLLRETSGSILWLLHKGSTAEQNLRLEAKARGVDPERLFFAENLPKEKHLARQQLADLALDTRIYNGHTTSIDALWAGVPLVTLKGCHFTSRVSSSLLTAIGLPEMITRSLEEYECLAMRLARNQNEMKAIRRKLEKNRLTEPLFDTPRFVRNLETAYKEIWKIFLSGEKPKQIEVREIGNRKLETEKFSGFDIAESLKQASQYYQSGVAFQQQGSFDEAISCFQQAAQLNPNDANIYVWLGILFQDWGRSDEAISYYRKALELKPDYAEVYNNIGNVYKDQGRFDEAVSYYRKALAQKPELAEAYGSIGAVLQDQGRIDEAISYYRKALELKPNLAEAYHSMGTALQDQGKFGEAVSYYRKALESDPNHGHACDSLVFLLKHTCGWHLLESFAEKHLDELTKKALDNGLKSPESPFLSLMRHDDPARHLAIARSHARDISARMSNLNMSFSFDERKRDKSKIALGYISGDFRDHPVGHLTAGLFRYHHREEFQVFCYSYGANDNSVYRKQISQECDKFLDIREMSHTDAAKRIYEDKVDILIDLTGYTWGNRIGICALRPAPVQVSWLGFSGTSGSDFFDYILSDKTVMPAHHSVYYTERFVYMPHSYMIGGNQAISDRQWRKADFGLPENAFVFCSFNQAYKIDPRLFDTWMKILRQVPESVLWLMGENKSAEEKLRQAAESRGVNPERLIFAKKLPSKSDHLARLKLADIALDTRVYNGHTTTVDALCAGLPVIALQGRHFASRSSSSLLQAAGLPELITRRLSRYESLAVRLASHPDALETIRIKLAQNHLTQPLFDLSRFVRNLESAYKEMWAIFRQGEKPRQIEVTESEDAESLHHLALSEHQKGSNDEALRLLIRARDIQSENFSYHFSLGYVLQSVGRSDEAIASYRKVIELKPDYAPAYYNMGNALLDQQKPDEAIVCYQKATEIKPDYTQAVNNMGNAYKRQGGWEEAVSCYEKSLAINPNQADTWYNMGNTFHEQGRADEAISCYHKSLELNPNHETALNSLVYLQQCLCDWQHLPSLTDKLDELTRKSLNSGKTPGEKPFENIGRHTDLSLNYAVAEAWARAIANSVSQWKSHFSFNHKKSSKKKITVAYLSNDFYDHPIAHLTSGLFGLHDRNEFEVLCYAYGHDDGSFYRKQIQETCDKFSDIRNLTYIDSAKRIYEDGADILIDLTGYTAGNRLGICALRPAPIQITYLGFAGTSGADFFDYIITDRIVTPPDHAAYYSEKFVYMPNAYMINDNTLPVSEKVLSKAEFGLPEQAFVFCSFNNTYKIEPLMFDVWMRMLQKIQGSVLWLSERNQTVETHLKQEAENRGVNPERIVFAKRLPSKSEHLARHKLADVVLDTRIFNGHTTTADALWAGLPVITLQGSHFASRVSASLLTAIGLPELITHNLDEYEKLAIRLASHPEQLQAIRQKLAKNRLTEPLFDTSRFVRDLESAYKEMWMMFLSGEKPRQIEVKEIRNASALQAETAEDYYKTGVAFKHQGNLNQALSCFQNALELKPDFPEVYVYIGNILQAQGSTDKAMTAYEKAVELKPDFAIAHNNMGNIFKNQRKREEAISCYRKALEADPNLAAACNNLVFDLQLSCLWQELAALNSRLDQFTKSALADGKKPDEDPFVNLTRHADPALNFEVAKAWSHETAAYVSYLRDIYKPERFSFDRRKSEKREIRVGYLSNTFYNHPGTHLILGLFGLHSRDEFEVFCYSYGKQEKGYYRTRIEKDCDHFADISKLNALDAAALIYRDRIDILVDLRGYTEGNTLLVPALRPAPIQVSYLGFPGTTGADFFDYIITDRIVTPPEHADYYSEKFVYLPHCYQINDRRQPIAEKEWKRADFGLPEHSFVFCSFTRGYKIEPLMFDVWMKILRQVQGSVLWLLPGSKLAENALKQEAKARGVNSRRLIFANVLPKAQHLARQKLADLMLDTRIYNGHTTSSDALWAGLPLITLQGSHFASGVSASILTAIGLPELITHSLEEYENLAVRLASHSEELQVIRRKLAQHRLTEPLFDTPRFVRNLESAYKEMRRIFISGEKPRRIEVNEEIFPSETRSSVSAFDVERELRNAVQYHQKGQLTEAEDIYRKILERHPNHPDALHLSGLTAHQSGKYDLAVNLIQKAIQQNPDNPAYYSNLALVFKAQGKLDETIFCLQKVLQFKPEDADTYHHLGTCCATQGRFGDAVSCYQKALKFKPDFVEAHSNLGNVLIDLGRLDEAIDCYFKALKIRPNFPAAIAGQAKVLMRKGEFEAAYRLILPVAMSRTKDIEAAVTYARLSSRFQQHREAAAFIEHLLASTETKADKSSLCFCLGDIYDAMGDYERALSCYTEANTLRHWQFDAKQHKRYISALIKIYNSGQKNSMSKADNRSELPVFIVGMPRSGTTLTEQILANHPRVFGAGELPDIEAAAHELRLSPNAELPDSDYLNSLTGDMLDKFANRYLERLRTFSDEASRITNKLPQNFLYLGLIAQFFPNARIIHCVRDARDTALSLYFQNFTGSHSYSFDLKNIGEYYSQYRRIMRHWKEIFQIPMLDVHYEELVSDHERVIRDMLAYLGLEWNEKCLRFYESKRAVVTASYQGVREPLHTRAAGRWKNYEKYLKPFFGSL